MSWITRCPDCDTVYAVASEQLQQANGWLRCGACQHVFDSAGRVVAADVIPTLTERVNVGAPQLGGRVDLERLLHKESPDPFVAGTDALSPPVPMSSSAPTPATPTPSAFATTPPVAQPETSDVADASPIHAFADALQSFKLPDFAAVPQQGEAPAKAPNADHDMPDEGSKTSSAGASRKPKALVALTMGLAIVLVFQGLLAGRTAFLAHWPQAGRVLSQWCTSAACQAQWQPPLTVWSLQAEPMALEGMGYRLSWTLKHSAAVPLAVPDLALKLLNAQGQEVAAQRLTSGATAAPPELAAGQRWQGNMQVDVPPDLLASQAQLRLLAR